MQYRKLILILAFVIIILLTIGLFQIKFSTMLPYYIHSSVPTNSGSHLLIHPSNQTLEYYTHNPISTYLNQYDGTITLQSQNSLNVYDSHLYLHTQYSGKLPTLLSASQEHIILYSINSTMQLYELYDNQLVSIFNYSSTTGGIDIMTNIIIDNTLYMLINQIQNSNSHYQLVSLDLNNPISLEVVFANFYLKTTHFSDIFFKYIDGELIVVFADQYIGGAYYDIYTGSNHCVLFIFNLQQKTIEYRYSYYYNTSIPFLISHSFTYASESIYYDFVTMDLMYFAFDNYLYKYTLLNGQIVTPSFYDNIINFGYPYLSNTYFLLPQIAASLPREPDKLILGVVINPQNIKLYNYVSIDISNQIAHADQFSIIGMAQVGTTMVFLLRNALTIVMYQYSITSFHSPITIIADYFYWIVTGIFMLIVVFIRLFQRRSHRIPESLSLYPKH